MAVCTGIGIDFARYLWSVGRLSFQEFFQDNDVDEKDYTPFRKLMHGAPGFGIYGVDILVKTYDAEKAVQLIKEINNQENEEKF